jgi:23S rRNA-/tRNA-specific pseudouridylate synthase
MSAPSQSPILREEEHWLWLDKPPGVPVFPPHRDPRGDCVLSRLLQARPDSTVWPEGFEGGIAHRLDVSTSGVVLAARTPEDLARARAAFSSRSLRKVYRFLSDGRVPWTEHCVTTELAHHRKRRDRMVVRRGQNTPHRGRWYAADTRFRHLGGPLWEAVIVTGVMHQIRLHAASVGITLRGDRIYGAPTWEEAPEGVDFALHHCRLEGLGGCPFSPPWF